MRVNELGVFKLGWPGQKFDFSEKSNFFAPTHLEHTLTNCGRPVAGAFLMLVAELILQGHTDGIQLVGVFASVAGLVMAVIALFAGTRLRNVLAILFLVLSISGIVGVLEHNESRQEEGEGEASRPAFVASTASNAAQNLPVSLRAEYRDQEVEEEGGGEVAPPPLAPLSLAGTSLMAAMALLGIEKPVKPAA